MSILIEGMEMPLSCGYCALKKFKYGIGDDCLFGAKETEYQKRPIDCPLIEVPEPHGRLIDADAYGEILRGLGSRDYRREKGTICDAIKMLQPHYAPTVIPASEEGEM